MLQRYSLVSLLVLSVGLSACSSWKADNSFQGAVFSDDGQGMAAVLLHFKGKNTITHTKMKDHEVQVLMKENLDGSTPAIITPKLAGKLIDLFFMRSQAYVILGRQTNWLGSYAGGDTGEVWYEKIGLDGTITKIAGGTFIVALTCGNDSGSASVAPPVRAIPSPNGALVALYESETTCTERVQTLTFLKASDLSVHSGPYDIPDVAPAEFNGIKHFPPVEMAWTQAGAFAVSYWGNTYNENTYSATVFKPGQEPDTKEAVGMDCFHPPTTSSEVNSDGTLVTIDEKSGTVGLGTPLSNEGGGLIPTDNTTSLVFGCGQ